MKFTNRDGEIRFYDASATPYYLKIVFSGGDLSGPLGQPTVEELLVLDRQRSDENSCYVAGSDAALLAPMELSFSVVVTDHAVFGHLLDWLDGSRVNDHDMVTTKGTTRRDGANNTPAFADGSKKCVNIEYRLDGPGGDLVWRYGEVWFPLHRAVMVEADDGIRVSLSGQVYGTVDRATAFTSGASAV